MGHRELQNRLLEIASRWNYYTLKSKVDFPGYPEDWYEAHRFRCTRNHVCTTFYHKNGKPCCIVCGSRVSLTFPIDVDGPLKDPHKHAWEVMQDKFRNIISLRKK